MTTNQTISQIEFPSQFQQILNLPPGNTAENLSIFKIPAGTEVYIGRIEDGGATATQIYIKNSDCLILIEDIKFNQNKPINK